jgi:hypothetical protein
LRRVDPCKELTPKHGRGRKSYPSRVPICQSSGSSQTKPKLALIVDLILFYNRQSFFLAMSVASSGSRASSRHPESPDRDAVMSDDCHLTTPSPPAKRDDSHDEYTPTRQSAQSGTVWITPSQRSSTTSLASSLRTALEDLYKKIYGQDSVRCLLPLGKGGLNVAHAVRRASKSPEVSHVHSLWLIYLIIRIANTIRILPRI